jgi:type II secretory pathway pseudopilin PulG
MVYVNATMKKDMKSRGFTLMEIMIGVSIMMIISGLSLASFTFSQRKSRDAKRKSSLAQISRALEVFNEDFGRYPESLNGEIIGCQPTAEDELENCAWGGELSAYPDGVYQLYMSKLPEDPKISFEYYYESDGEDINLYAALENDQDKDYRSDLILDCGGSLCSYLLTEYGVTVE